MKQTRHQVVVLPSVSDSPLTWALFNQICLILVLCSGLQLYLIPV